MSLTAARSGERLRSRRDRGVDLESATELEKIVDDTGRRYETPA